MFEHYTERARRAIFYAHREAAAVGSPYIEPEHLLLGISRETTALFERLGLPPDTTETLRSKLDTEHRPPSNPPISIPLSDASKQVLASASQEADRLQHRHIGTRHLLLGLLHEENAQATRLLLELGVTLDAAREKLADGPDDDAPKAPADLPAPPRNPGQAKHVIVFSQPG
jgi:ATP-dependent Clp protease ATP-binding subunit ClpC